MKSEPSVSENHPTIFQKRNPSMRICFPDMRQL